MFLFYIFCYNLTWTSFLCSTFILHVYVLSDLRAVHLVYVYFMMLLKWVKFTQSCLALCNPIDYTVHEILQARILEWVAVPLSRGSSQPRDQIQTSYIPGRFFTSWAKREAQNHTYRCFIYAYDCMYKDSTTEWLWFAFALSKLLLIKELDSLI